MSDYTLPDHCLNTIQRASLDALLRIAKGAHIIDLRVRINGEDHWFDADWIKSLCKPTPDGEGE